MFRETAMKYKAWKDVEEIVGLLEECMQSAPYTVYDVITDFL